MNSVPQPTIQTVKQRFARKPAAETVVGTTTVPVITLNASDFVDALTKRDKESPTALEALESLARILCSQSVVSDCNMCDGEGKTIDPFEEGEVWEECSRCKGRCETTDVIMPGDMLEQVALLSELGMDLHAALDFAQRGERS